MNDQNWSVFLGYEVADPVVQDRIAQARSAVDKINKS